MQTAGNNPAAIVSKRIIASHQICSIMQQQGWTPRILDGHTTPDDIHALQPEILVADIDDAACNGLSILRWFREFSPMSYAVALCAGGCSPAMHRARHFGVDGFLYLNAAGLSLDPERGVMPLLKQPGHAVPGPRAIFTPTTAANRPDTHSPHY